MSGGSDEVQAGVNSHVKLLTSLRLLLLPHETLMLIVLPRLMSSHLMHRSKRKDQQ